MNDNKLYELAMELNDYDFAINGLLSNRRVSPDNTMIYLETTSLLAICYIRKLEIAKAKPYLKEVLTNEKVMPSAGERKIWRQQMINRFKEEVIVSSLKSSSKPVYDEAEIDREVVRIMRNKSEQEIYEEIGKAAPKATRKMLSVLNDFSSEQLSSQHAAVGLTVFESIKRVMYHSLCRPESDLYKAWFNNGMQRLLSKEYISAMVTTCLINLGIGMQLLAAYFIALITKFGIEVYCEKYKPAN
jgi:hypothetical protein